MCVKYFVDIFNEVFTWCHQTIAAPTLLTATFVPPNVELAWTDNATNEDCYMIWRSTDGTNFTLIETVNTEDLESYTDTTAAAGVLYYYKVQACNSNGDTSDFSNIVQVTNTLSPVTYGYLYNWHAATDVRVMAPTGWHLPTLAEYDTLVSFLGGYAVAGGKMKEVGIYWAAPNTGADNSSGFTARGAGKRNGVTGAFETLRSESYLTINKDYIGGCGFVLLKTTNAEAITGTSGSYQIGASVRWIKDDVVNPGTVADYDGNIYGCVTIGTQVWTDRNAIVTHYNNGDEIPYEADAGTWAGLATGARCLYNNSWAYL